MAGSTSASESRVVLFLSADLSGSSAFKGRAWPIDKYSSGQPPWAEQFVQLYRRFPVELETAWNQQSHGVGSPPTLVKAIGDEILLAAPIRSSQQAKEVLTAFIQTLKQFNSEYGANRLPLQLKGTAWIAGFPINNHELTTGDGRSDYIGPSIDLGFRLSKFSTQRKLVVSADLAILLLNKHAPFKFFFDGTSVLKGVLGDRGYPILWIDTGPPHMEDDLIGVNKQHCDEQKLDGYCRSFIESAGDDSWLIIPYLSDDPSFSTIPARHEEILTDWRREDDKTRNVGDDDSGSAPVEMEELHNQLNRVERRSDPLTIPRRLATRRKRAKKPPSNPPRKK